MITTVSRLTPWKRVDLLIRAFSAVDATPKSGGRLLLFIAGTGRPAPERKLRAMAAASPRRDCIRFLGDVPQTEVWRIIRSSDVIASFYDLSNVGNVLLEALHLNTVVVARDTGGTSKVISSGKTASLCRVARRQRSERLRQSLADWRPITSAAFAWPRTLSTGHKRTSRTPNRDFTPSMPGSSRG